MQIYTVAQLAEYIKASLDRDRILNDIWVTGEVSNLFASGVGHRYFTLKSAEHQIKAVLFSDRQGGEHAANGAQITACGRVSFYPARGETQLYADALFPSGSGALAAEFERLKAMLEAEGLFDAARKRALPPFPRKIGVATSAQGAVIHDIVTVLRARYPLGHVVLCDAVVQGADAPAEIAAAIRALNAAQTDVIIVARGGGSLEDLWAFNSEPVARAVYASRVPVVSAVGHESDYTIADYVADLRAPTPSAAAAIVAPDVRVLAAEAASLADRARGATVRYAALRRADVESLTSRMRRAIPDADAHRQRVDELLERARAAHASSVRFRREQVAALQKTLDALNPASVLERGYAVVARADGRPVASASDVAPGDPIRATLRDGAVEAVVTSAK